MSQGSSTNSPKAKAAFFMEFLRKPTQMGAISRSSSKLGPILVSGTDIEKADVVVEYGAGDGAYTREIVNRLKPGATFFAIELSSTLCELFRQRHPDVTIYNASVADVGSLLEKHGLSRQNSVDVVVSGLPWASFSESLQLELMNATLAVLKPGGHFVTFTYWTSRLTSAGRRFRRMLPTWFSKVHTSEVLFVNIPPAYAFKCVK